MPASRRTAAFRDVVIVGGGTADGCCGGLRSTRADENPHPAGGIAGHRHGRRRRSDGTPDHGLHPQLGIAEDELVSASRDLQARHRLSRLDAPGDFYFHPSAPQRRHGAVSFPAYWLICSRRQSRAARGIFDAAAAAAQNKFMRPSMRPTHTQQDHLCAAFDASLFARSEQLRQAHGVERIAGTVCAVSLRGEDGSSSP